MAHLHIPDGVLPLLLWGPAWLVAIGLLVWTARVQRSRPPQKIAYEGALGALMLAAMALEIPLGPVEYHLTLAGPIGVLLGATGAFQAAFIASAVLAFIGHGGLTVIGLNALLLGAAAAVAARAYRAFARPGHEARGLALATALGHLVSGLLWLGVMLIATRTRAQALVLAHAGQRLGVVAGVAVPLMAFAIAAETAAAFGMGQFLARVRPDLMPRALALGEAKGTRS